MAVELEPAGLELGAVDQGLDPMRILGGSARQANVYPKAGIDGTAFPDSGYGHDEASLGGAKDPIHLAQLPFG